MSGRTRTCHECQHPYPLEGIYFRPVGDKHGSGFDTVCIQCRDRLGPRAYDVVHGKKPEVALKGFPE